MLRIEKLNFAYQKQKILKEIDFYLEKGEFVGIIGPNGSGKTTLLKNISRYLKPDAGHVYLNNEELSKYSSRDLARKMAVVPQETVANFNFTVYELVMMGRNPYQNRWGMVSKEDRKIVQDALAKTDTLHFKNKKINELSGGERQRVIIARALAQKPKLLLLDEPTASLDINYQQEIFDLLASLNEEMNLSILVVTHDLNLSSQYCSKLVLIHQGEIYRIGSPAEVLNEKTIKKVYKTEVSVTENPMTGRPFIILYPEKKERHKEGIKKKIHIICGGGSGRSLLKNLANKGYTLSCGVLNRGDSDWELALSLGVEVVDTAPFSAINQESLEKNKELIQRADVVIVADVPFGNGNLANLKLLSDVKTKQIILINKTEIEKKDYTGGLAKKFWQDIMRQDNACSVSNLNDALNLIN